MACLLCGGAGHLNQKAVLENPYTHTALDMSSVRQYVGAQDLVRLNLSNNILRADGVSDLITMLKSIRYERIFVFM